MMPGGLSGADWSWVGGLVLVQVRLGRDPGWEAGPGKKAAGGTG